MKLVETFLHILQLISTVEDGVQALGMLTDGTRYVLFLGIVMDREGEGMQ